MPEIIVHKTGSNPEIEAEIEWFNFFVNTGDEKKLKLYVEKISPYFRAFSLKPPVSELTNS